MMWGYRLSTILCILICIYACSTRPAHSQTGNWNDGHAEHHDDFYKNLKQPDNGYSCCNAMTATEGDCRPVRWYPGYDGLFYAFINGRWKPVPPNKVVTTTESPDGYGHVCANRYTDDIYCFIPGKVFR